MSKSVIIVDKKAGQTPLEAIDEQKISDPALLNLPLTYAGRLDPLASGVLVILAGDECLKKDEYLALEKEYELTILFGFSTDTYDLMGKVMEMKSKEGFEMVWLSKPAQESEDLSNSSFDEIKEKIKYFVGRINQKYPPYSSRTVAGKPLYQWAREGRLDEITIPSHEVFVKNIDVVGNNTINGKDLESKIKEVVALVNGDFRQKEILDLWHETLADKQEEIYQTVTLKVACGSGVYVRGIAHELGQKMGIPALAFNIKRTKVGEYTL